MRRVVAGRVFPFELFGAEPEPIIQAVEEPKSRVRRVTGVLVRGMLIVLDRHIALGNEVRSVTS
jgi:hypothetical protein